MAIQKRKAVSRVASGSRALSKSIEKVGKGGRKSAAQKKKQEEEEEQMAVEQGQQQEEEEEDAQAGEEGDEEEEGEEDDTEKVDKEAQAAEEEEKLQQAKRKELKAMYIDELKEVVARLGLEASKKEAMVEAVVAAEAKERAEAKEHQLRLRSVVVNKKSALEAMPIAELRDVCNTYGIKGQLTKQARIEQVLKLWQQQDGVDKALAEMARNKREEELNNMEKAELKELCEKQGVDVYIDSIIAERLVRFEAASGKFGRPTMPVIDVSDEEKGEQTRKRKAKVDMVDELLQNEARRKKEAEEQKQREEAEAAKRKEFKAMSVEDIKKTLASKGREALGKKDDMVESLLAATQEEEKLAAKKAKLKALSTEELKSLASKNNIKASKKDEIVEALLKVEADGVAAIQQYQTMIEEASSALKERLESKTAAELKDLCAEQGLKLGVGKEGRVETLLEAAKSNGSLEMDVACTSRAARAKALSTASREELLALAEAAGIDCLVKEVLVERLMAHEGQSEAAEPSSKRQRKA